MNVLNIDPNFYLSKVAVTIAILIVNLVLSFVAKKFIEVFFARVTTRFASERTLARTETLKNLFKNIVDFVLFLIAVLIILSQWEINILPILTGAGLLGLAVTFGAQTFIKDLIAGMFIIIEDQYHIGDYVIVDKFEGKVVSISLRITVLQDNKGNTIFIPNSQITALTKLKETKKKVN